MPVLEQAVVPKRQRARSDEAHLALDDIDDLRDLVEREAAQEPSDSGHTRVLADLEQRTLRLVRLFQARLERGCLGHHRPELEHSELSLADADSTVDEEDGAARV